MGVLPQQTFSQEPSGADSWTQAHVAARWILRLKGIQIFPSYGVPFFLQGKCPVKSKLSPINGCGQPPWHFSFRFIFNVSWLDAASLPEP